MFHPQRQTSAYLPNRQQQGQDMDNRTINVTTTTTTNSINHNNHGRRSTAGNDDDDNDNGSNSHHGWKPFEFLDRFFAQCGGGYDHHPRTPITPTDTVIRGLVVAEGATRIRGGGNNGHGTAGTGIATAGTTRATATNMTDRNETRRRQVRSRSNSNNNDYHHPQVVMTLFYDGVKRLTVAVLSPCHQHYAAEYDDVYDEHGVDSYLNGENEGGGRGRSRSSRTVMSDEDDGTACYEYLSRYLRSRVDRGTAYCVSPLYYELEGYVRENAYEIRRRLVSIHVRPGSLSIAVGSLEESDDAQKRELIEREHQHQYQHHHNMMAYYPGSSIPRTASSSSSPCTESVSPSSSEDTHDGGFGYYNGRGHQREGYVCEFNLTAGPAGHDAKAGLPLLYDGNCETTNSISNNNYYQYYDLGRLEEVMEIVRLNRLNDDLDVLSIYFMRLTNKTFGRIAARIARHRMEGGGRQVVDNNSNNLKRDDTTDPHEQQQQRQQQGIQIKLVPYVDGVKVTGYSKFARRDGRNYIQAGGAGVDGFPGHQQQNRNTNNNNNAVQLVRHYESGRAVEYEMCPTIELKPSFSISLLSENDNNTTHVGTFVPIYRSIDHEENIDRTNTATMMTDNLGDNTTAGSDSFTWKCEEVTLANLHRWWGDVTIPDYVGQKLQLCWMIDRNTADFVTLQNLLCDRDGSSPTSAGESDDDRNDNVDEGNDGEGGDENSSNNRKINQDAPMCLNLVTLRLPIQTGPPRGVHVWSSFESTVRLNVVESNAKELDDVATMYTGKAQVQRVTVNFLCLVRAEARMVATRLQKQYEHIQEHRPLLPREEEYIKLVESIAKSQ